jgi:hypothetical protein
MGHQGAQIRKNARERQAAILRRHFSHILHCRENQDADCTKKNEQEVLFGGQTKHAILHGNQSRILKYGSHGSALARTHDSLLSRAPSLPSPKHHHMASTLPRQFSQSSEEKSISIFAESTVMSQSDDDDSRQCENDEELFMETPTNEPALQHQIGSKTAAEYLLTDDVEKECEDEGKDKERKKRGYLQRSVGSSGH